MPNLAIEQCGNCAWAAVIKQDITKRICHGAPPQIVLIPAAQGLSMQSHWPMVDATGHICSLFKQKINLDTIKIDV